MTNDRRPGLAEVTDGHRAAAILRMLASDEVRGRLNDALIADLLDEVALSGSAGVIRACLRRLEDSGLITLQPVAGRDIFIADLTKQGLEAAEGRTRVDWIRLHSAGNPY